MANEISMSASVKVTATNFAESFNPGAVSIDLASSAGAGGTQPIGTSVEAIVKGDTAAGGVFFFRNIDETNYVEIGRTSNGATNGIFYPFVKLLAGEFAVGRLASADVFARANTAGIVLQYRMLSP